MASITRSVSPFATRSPGLTATWVIFPGSGAVSVWPPWPAGPPPCARMMCRVSSSTRITHVSPPTPTTQAPPSTLTSTTCETPSMRSEPMPCAVRRASTSHTASPMLSR